MSDRFALGTVEVALTPSERFEEFLQSRGKRNTQQRRVIVELVFGRHQHFDADELIDQLARHADGRKIGRATVYRTLAELVEAGLLIKMDLGGRAVYEHDYGYPNHDHLHCDKCGKLIEFRSGELLQLRDAVARERGFRVSGHRFLVSGVCGECQRAERRKISRLDLV